MTFETMDWEAEAQRISVAFNVHSEGRFNEHDPMPGFCTYKLIRQEEGKSGYSGHYPMIGTAELYIQYGPRGQSFTLERDMDTYTSVFILWNGTSDDISVGAFDSLIMAEGLFNLGLLTPELEAAMQISISNHQKLEWQLEYDKRVGTVK